MYKFFAIILIVLSLVGAVYFGDLYFNEQFEVVIVNGPSGSFIQTTSDTGAFDSFVIVTVLVSDDPKL